jgi:hypothetical protein
VSGVRHFPAAVDTIVVGAGTAGATVAGRLAAGSSGRTLLLAAGPDYGPADSGRGPGPERSPPDAPGLERCLPAGRGSGRQDRAARCRNWETVADERERNHAQRLVDCARNTPVPVGAPDASVDVIGRAGGGTSHAGRTGFPRQPLCRCQKIRLDGTRWPSVGASGQNHRSAMVGDRQASARMRMAPLIQILMRPGLTSSTPASNAQSTKPSKRFRTPAAYESPHR